MSSASALRHERRTNGEEARYAKTSREPLMPNIEPTVEFNEGFSEPGAGPPPWADVADVLTTSEMFWL